MLSLDNLTIPYTFYICYTPIARGKIIIIEVLKSSEEWFISCHVPQIFIIKILIVRSLSSSVMKVTPHVRLFCLIYTCITLGKKMLDWHFYHQYLDEEPDHIHCHLKSQPNFLYTPDYPKHLRSCNILVSH